MIHEEHKEYGEEDMEVADQAFLASRFKATKATKATMDAKNTKDTKYTKDTKDTKDTRDASEGLEIDTDGKTGQNDSTYFDTDVCKSLICPTCTVNKEAEDTRLRSLAEMENFKKRLQKEKNEQMQYATESVLADLVPTLDNLDLAIQYGNVSEACKEMLMGVEMTRKVLLDSLKRQGLDLIGVVGEEFDPKKYEAIGQEESEDIPVGHICAVMQKGYMLKGRLLRPAKVVVSAKANGGINIDVKV